MLLSTVLRDEPTSRASMIIGNIGRMRKASAQEEAPDKYLPVEGVESVFEDHPDNRGRKRIGQ